MTQPRIGIYPGTFDPITNGHADIIRRAIKIVDRLVIGVARSDGKGPLFATDERVEIVRDEVARRRMYCEIFHLNGRGERSGNLRSAGDSAARAEGHARRQAAANPGAAR